MPGHLSSPVRALGVLTGGGDVPGLNAAIKALVYSTEPLGIRIIGLREGWEGITYLDRSRGLDALIFNTEDPVTWDATYFFPLNVRTPRPFDGREEHFLHSTRPIPTGYAM